MRQIAVYGKGGIGKSTISANISAALAENNKKVLQIGCDPKHDSTRLLMGGREITTVLDYIKGTSPDRYKLSDILFEGYKGVSCVEAGGPEPGVGCAGRGILTTFDLLEKLGVFKNNYDAVIYDVLGDVVCGGFAVPIRHEYADVVYIVTSGEFMSIYAANNILRGLKNFDGSIKRVGGIIFNRRGIENEDERIKNFSNAVKLPVCEEFPRDNVFALAEKNGCTVIEEFNENYISKKFKKLAIHVINNNELYEAVPLSDSQLEEVVLHKKKKYCNVDTSKKENLLQNEKNKVEEENSTVQYLSKDVLMKEPLHGCAFNGAVNTAVQMEDAVTVAHGPKSCAHISYQTITSIGRKSFFERGVLIPVQISPSLISSEMNEGVMVFGGLEELKEKILKLKKYKPAAVFVVTTCPSGIIGEDINVVQNIDMDGIPVIPINTDGNITGDYLQGIITSYIEIAKSLIKINIEKEDNTVNIVAEKPIASSTDKNYNIIKNLLNELGIKINCRFLCNSSVKDVKNFLKAEANILAYEDYMGRTIKQFLENEYKADFIKRPFPIGFKQTRNWLAEIADVFNKSVRINEIIDKYKIYYQEGIKKLKLLLENKKLMIITYNHDIDWLIETIFDLNMKITKVCILNYSQDNIFRTDFKGKFKIEENYDPEKRKNDIEKLKPDLVLSNYTSSALGGSVCTDTIPLCPDVGFFSGLEIAKRWAGLISFDLKEGWKKDEKLFRKYYA